jgi:hypothetical protein
MREYHDTPGEQSRQRFPLKGLEKIQFHTSKSALTFAFQT